MVKMPKISVIIPVYNVEKYLEKCLESIVNQTLHDIEIICINDGSKDNSGAILCKFASKDRRIKIVDRENGGLACARNTGLALARGEFIGFVDSDDWIDLDFYEKLYNAAAQNTAEIAAAGIIRKNDKTHKIRLKFEKQGVLTAFEDKINCIDAINSPSVWNKIYKRAFLDKIGLKFQNVKHYEDGHFTINALYYSDKFVTVPDANYYYFINPSSIVKSGKTKEKTANKLTARTYCVNFIREKGAKLRDWSFCAETLRVSLFGIALFSIKESFHSKKVFLFALIPVWKINL